ncbi:AhpC/TSA family protein [Chitinophaga ginsengisegetis]|uniref:AhpC/TSA family protein n=1 Tax=Chitinophaga ginsengisegetis TaxID=393003 RepID=UPI000DBA3BD0|nr:AhpC/TSA family protein [Chitinophaga ginsengisegetis]MDR6566976.1 peroxiredoxin [Chitinophaga ginsengisegetis]MDR6646706.1 peroxiredoxin [Chitinophaga ginsengisegetis]MDR6653056.1 peroxiredoxin [Chitinophaga ginsengisegetis]
MKQIFLLAAAVLVFAGANAQQVSGIVRGGNGKTIYLFNDQDNNPDDSAVIKNEQFSFRVKGGKEPAVYALILQDVNYPLLFVTGNEPVQVTTSVATYPIATSVKGNENTLAMQEYQKAFEPLIKQAQELNEEAKQINPEDEPGKNAFRKKAETFSREVVNTGKQFITSHPKSIASIWLMMNELRSRLEPEEFRQLFESLDKSVQESQYGQSVTAYVKSLKANVLNVAADDFSQEDTKGKPVKLSSFRGKYVLVDFWASWCGPCRQENPNVVKAYNRFKDKNFTILGVSLDDNRDRWLRAIDQDGLAWTQVSDLRGWGNEVAVQYGVQSIPTNFLVDPTGKIIARNLRGEELEAKLEQLLK